MKTADLRKYRKNVEALEAINRLLDEKAVSDSVQGSHGAPDYALTHRKVEGLPRSKGTIALLQTKSEITKEQAAIRLLISGIKERRIYEALFFYCLSDDLDDPTWEDVAERMHEDSPQALRIAVERHLEKFFKNVRICS
jgi:hypothetical protein